MPMIDRELARKIIRYYPLIKAFAEGRELERPFRNYCNEFICWDGLGDKFHLEYIDDEWRVRGKGGSVRTLPDKILLETESGEKIAIPLEAILNSPVVHRKRKRAKRK